MPYRLIGGIAGMQAGALAVNAAAAVGIVAVARRLAGQAAGWAAVTVVSVSALAWGPAVPADPWCG